MAETNVKKATTTTKVAKNNKKVIYIDTEGGISIDRIKQIAWSDFSNVANNIIVFEPTSFTEQNDTLKSIDESNSDNGSIPVKTNIAPEAMAIYVLYLPKASISI